MAERKYFWIKLKKDFMTSDAVDFLMSQKNGSEYVVLYQMLCLMTVKSNGKLERQLNEIIIPYDIEKIQRDTKYFNIDTVRTALNLYVSLGLIYKDENGCLSIANFKNLVGSETGAAERMRKMRNNVTPMLQNCDELRYTDIDKDIDKDIDIDNKKEINKEKRKNFQKPTLQELIDFCNSENLENVDCEKFINYYDSNGWLVGKNPMKDWKATARNWNRKQFPQSTYKTRRVQLEAKHLNDNQTLDFNVEDLPF
ncbi:phage replisome organizer N-terminal domain-containing protein [Bulleidia sp. zg-1006]|uniref:phage replisome organizer N-terminal domain-containing protein n=1 Tax=Bulleidia sp. zg-1006 TaxID=2806552 RepID=UPI0019393D77|nr:phage replisome organizer N-terminal domain-containing protein [Bulleidia sp. zg-1006]QRG86390.1 phage replisome organizer N-terminal domain-containing protein [Bulleidia sp. zg-1006]